MKTALVPNISVRLAAGIAVLLAAVCAGAATAAELRPGGAGMVREIVDGDTLILATGDQVRLVGIQAPKLPLGRKGFRAWPLAEDAKTALAALTLGKSLTLSHGGRRVDRHGRLLAHLYDDAGRWIQGELLRRGLARVYSFADNRALIAEMLARENTARAAGRGIWSRNKRKVRAFYAIREVTETPQFLNSFQLVEGRVKKVAVVRGTAYLNYGDDWKTDFTVAIPPPARRLFKKSGREVDAFAGQRIRVRGWLKPRNGPMIVVTHPEQIEVLE